MLLGLLQSQPFVEFWQYLNLESLEFADVGLAPNAADSEICQACQSAQLILITANRNATGPDSLEEAVRSFNTEQSLPVLTIGRPGRVLRDREYATSVVGRVLDYLLEIDRYRGVGRLYVP